MKQARQEPRERVDPQPLATFFVDIEQPISRAYASTYHVNQRTLDERPNSAIGHAVIVTRWVFVKVRLQSIVTRLKPASTSGTNY